MLQVAENSRTKWLVGVQQVTAHYALPKAEVRIEETTGFDVAVPFELEELVALTLEEAVADFLEGREVLVVLLNHVKNGATVGVVNLGGPEVAPVQAQPLVVCLLHEAELLAQINLLLLHDVQLTLFCPPDIHSDLFIELFIIADLTQLQVFAILRKKLDLQAHFHPSQIDNGLGFGNDLLVLFSQKLLLPACGLGEKVWRHKPLSHAL